MPTSGSGVGFSSVTEVKQEHFRLILRTHLRIVKAIFKKHNNAIDTFHYFDINSGPGELNGEKGSPMIFLEEVERANLNYRAVFIDKDYRNVDNLDMLTSGYDNVTIFHGDHSKILPLLYSENKRWRYGLLYTDPNGVFNDKALSRFSQQQCFKALDILINCPASAIKRMKNSSRCSDKRTLEDRLACIDKKYWLVRNSLKNSTWQWTFLLGTNWTKFPEFSKIEMVRLTSEKGDNFFKKLNFTAKELKDRDKVPLFGHKFSDYGSYLRSNEFLAVRNRAFKRARGICEVCGIDYATEPHHLKYASWIAGEIDVPENLIAVCHQCHCKIHGKEA